MSEQKRGTPFTDRQRRVVTIWRPALKDGYGQWRIGEPPPDVDLYQVLDLVEANRVETGERDWTCVNGRSNSSPMFLDLVDLVESLIRSDAHSLIAGRAGSTARMIVAHLAHERHLVPASTQAETYRRDRERA